MTEAAVERGAGHPDARHGHAGHGVAEALCRRVHDAPGRTGRHHGAAARRVDADRVHRAQVDHDAVAAGHAGRRVPAGAHGQWQLGGAGELDGGRDVSRPDAADDHRRAALRGAVPDRGRVGVVGVVRRHHSAVHASAQRSNR
jgi:hypothetical protein